jgi:hypothetical protein
MGVSKFQYEMKQAFGAPKPGKKKKKAKGLVPLGYANALRSGLGGQTYKADYNLMAFKKQVGPSRGVTFDLPGPKTELDKLYRHDTRQLLNGRYSGKNIDPVEVRNFAYTKSLFTGRPHRETAEHDSPRITKQQRVEYFPEA